MKGEPEVAASTDGRLVVDGVPQANGDYVRYHGTRIRAMIDIARRTGAARIAEIGGHPWVMTAWMLDAGGLRVCATVSAEEATRWPDDVGVRREMVRIETPGGRSVQIPKYVANVERTLFDMEERPDAIVACEIIEHLIRAPHVMLLNANRWLPLGGVLILSTPNGAQFSNPFRIRSPAPLYRCRAYERHSYLYTRDDLVDLISLCGFRVMEARYLAFYPRRGMARAYAGLARLPSEYLRAKFMQTIVVVARKEADVSELGRHPRVYDPRGDWELIASPPPVPA